MCRYGPQNQNNFNSISMSSEEIRYGFSKLSNISRFCLLFNEAYRGYYIKKW